MRRVDAFDGSGVRKSTTSTTIPQHPELVAATDVYAMQTTRLTRSSVLGKRAHQQPEASVPAPCEQQLQTPDPTPNPKRVRTSIGVVDDDANKENVPPFSPELVNIDISTPRSARPLRRTATELITPTRARPTPRRYASSSTISSSPATPTGEISHLAISTPPPTPPFSLLSIHARARALLRSTCNNTNTAIAGRDAERATINEFITSFLGDSNDTNDASSTSLYISGSPGTGKTALVNSVLRSIPSEAKIVFINCMALNNVESLWDRLIEELEDSKKHKASGRAKKVKGRDAIESLLSHHKTKCIVILDELDHITPTTQSLSSLFSLPNTTPSTLRIIGIANTHTLTSSSSSTSSISAASNVQTLHFAPYTPAQLQAVLQSRLQPLYEVDSADDGKLLAAAKKLLPPPTLMLLTKKVAALTGDVRSLFEVLRGAIDLAVIAAATSSPTSPSLASVNEDPLATPTPTVTPAHILAALKAYTPSSTSTSTTKATLPSQSNAPAPSTGNSEIVAKISNLGLQARLALLCILLASKRLEADLPLSASASSSPKKSPSSPMKRSSSLPNPNSNGVGIDPSQLHAYYGTILTRSDSSPFEAVSRSEFGDLVGVLEGIGLVCLGGAADLSSGTGAKRAFGRSASFGGGAGFGGAGKGKGKGEVRLAKGVRTDEVLRGLGITDLAETPADVIEEEVHAIWAREKARLSRDLKAIERERARTKASMNGFEGALED
ncbi:Cell division control protein 6 [Hypsizygus marmoreus]|uniref:Cell division control protein 6 n=1 Tax=Hypsizygus marmoreus TaxID=39966 RepID=A0A369J891_HYPMA|nr:Cell division control protein 6 [Hypsizygus marmoreus]